MPRRLLPLLLLGLVAAALTAWTAMSGGYLWTDYEHANVEPFRAIADGDWPAFFQTAPIEGPSLLMRAPFALLPSLWGGGDTAIFWTVAIPGVMAGAFLGVGLYELHRRAFPLARWGLVVLLLAAANPLSYRALEIGHPEEILGAVLCVAAVIAALRDRPWLAAVLLGLALANKAWAVLAIGPVLLALREHRWRTLLTAFAVGGLFVAPFLLNGAAREALTSAGSTDAVFQPWQVFWPLGAHGEEIRGFGNILKPGYRSAPGWIAPITHPLIAFLVLPASLLWLRMRGRERSVDILLLLALLFLLRCGLDVANNAYYHVPFVIALLAWEALRSSRPPIASLTATVAFWLTCVKAPEFASPDVQWAMYMAVALPSVVALFCAAYGVRPTFWRRRARLATAG